MLSVLYVAFLFLFDVVVVICMFYLHHVQSELRTVTEKISCGLIKYYFIL